MSSPLVSIVIVNWNGILFLEPCLASVYSQGYGPFEVIVHDNGSTDGSIEFLKEKFPDVKITESTENLGFAAGNNRAIEAASGEYVLTLNNDTELADGFIEKLLDVVANSAKDAGMWAPKILSLNNKDEIDSVGGLLIYPDCLAKGRGRLEVDRGQFDSVEEIFVPSACAALYRMSMLSEIGLFDEDFFAYCEDTDLGFRARLAGWKALSVPKAVVYHYYSGTGGRYTPFKAFLVERNHIWVALKCLPLSRLLLLPFYIKWRLLVQFYGVVTGRGAGGRFVESFSVSKLFVIMFKAYFGIIWGLPNILKKRRRIKKLTVVTSSEIGSWFLKFGLSAGELVLKD